MKNPIMRSCSDQVCLVILSSILFCLIFLSFDYSTFSGPNKRLTVFVDKQEHSPVIMNGETTSAPRKPGTDDNVEESISDSCSGRYVYIYDLPKRFNYDLLENCQSITRGTDKPNMCPYMVNSGLGPEIENPDGVLSNMSWFHTNQFMLEVIFHSRMKKYECLTNDSSMASAIFVPFYAGLDVSRFLWVSNLTVRDSSGKDLLRWIASRPEWKKMCGRDHFLVAGRISWDFRRQYDNLSYWGSKFRFLPESNNISMLSVEGSSWRNDYAIPYPTYFHPMNDSEVFQWQNKIRQQKRPYLFTFAGAPIPELENSIRDKLIEHCKASSGCKFIDCSYGENNCDNPVHVIKVFQNSEFCLQPRGDSYTRRSIFDSMLAGCIPVFFHPGTAYSQYTWYFPKNRTKYSVYIPVRDVKEWNVNVETVLQAIPEHEKAAIREEVIRLIPSIIYANRKSSELGTIDDSFDIAVKGVLERIEAVRKVIRDGGDPSIGFADADYYKYTFFIIIVEQETYITMKSFPNNYLCSFLSFAYSVVNE